MEGSATRRMRRQTLVDKYAVEKESVVQSMREGEDIVLPRVDIGDLQGNAGGFDQSMGDGGPQRKA